MESYLRRSLCNQEELLMTVIQGLKRKIEKNEHYSTEDLDFIQGVYELLELQVSISENPDLNQAFSELEKAIDVNIDRGPEVSQALETN